MVGSGAGVADNALIGSASPGGGDEAGGANASGGAGTTLGVRLMMRVFFRNDGLVAHVFSKTSCERHRQEEVQGR